MSTIQLTQEPSRGGATAGRYLTYADGVVQHGFGVGGVVAAGQLGVAKVCLQQQVGLCVGAVVGVRIDLQGELLSQLAVQLVLVVSDWQLCVLLRVLKDKGSAVSAGPRVKTRVGTVQQQRHRRRNTGDICRVIGLLQVGFQRSGGECLVQCIKTARFGSSSLLMETLL